jgi:hypothetical protein
MNATHETKAYDSYFHGSSTCFQNSRPLACGELTKSNEAQSSTRLKAANGKYVSKLKDEMVRRL